MAIVLPGIGDLPPGPRRNLVEALHELYTEAGRPGTRSIATGMMACREALPTTVSHETLNKLLQGQRVPGWPLLEATIRYLAFKSPRKPPPEPIVLRFHALWREECDAPSTVDIPPPQPITADTLTAALRLGDADAALRLSRLTIRRDQPMDAEQVAILVRERVDELRELVRLNAEIAERLQVETEPIAAMTTEQHERPSEPAPGQPVAVGVSTAVEMADESIVGADECEDWEGRPDFIMPSWYGQTMSTQTAPATNWIEPQTGLVRRVLRAVLRDGKR
ncbi:hypothetical protein LO772_07960 [Yinghuangia sp. ASG 101]|uniref:hypothetical protein n=1 Tax=Yinghuangia sp. ASG 101 TaxID=2896848 RepID=UPI001E4D3110|nr:hypothetical protein [Yinghuangia sp. ASG 101]UGQ13528.1 hypothetical protein LO772_07960 [Yinghuangia sp. ASG 101]